VGDFARRKEKSSDLFTRKVTTDPFNVNANLSFKRHPKEGEFTRMGQVEIQSRVAFEGF
jgi:hypothetical protein